MGSGKTTVARQLGLRLGAPVHALDEVAYPQLGVKRPWQLRRVEAERIAMAESWVTEGLYLGWVEPLLSGADQIVWLDVPWRVAAWRIVRRHVTRSLAHKNEHAGLTRLCRFLLDAHHYYTANGSAISPDDDGGCTRSATAKALEPYWAKVLVYSHLRRDELPLVH